MARRKATRSARSRVTTSSTTRGKSGGGGLAKYILPAAALGIAAYLLWPKTANAGQVPPPGVRPAVGPTPQPLPIPQGTSSQEPVADAQLDGGQSLGRIIGSGVNVRRDPNDNGAIVSVLPLNAGVAVVDSTRTAPTGKAPYGWYQVRTARGAQGYVAAQYINIEGGFQGGEITPATAGWYRRR